MGVDSARFLLQSWPTVSAWVRVDTSVRLPTIVAAGAALLVLCTPLIRRLRSQSPSRYAYQAGTSVPVGKAVAIRTTEIPDPERLATAAHEAAHLIASIVLNLRVTEVIICSRRPTTGNSLVELVCGPPMSLDQPFGEAPTAWWKMLVSLLAGNAHDRITGRPGWGSTVDTEQAHKIASLLYRHRTPLEQVSGCGSADEIFDKATAQATDLVRTHLDAIDNACTLLMAHTQIHLTETVSGAALTAIIAQLTPQVR
ncbi:hypothetical protein [Mycobacteroides abscessus]